MMLVIGSAAMAEVIPNSRTPIDIDVIVSPEEFEKFKSEFPPTREEQTSENHIALFYERDDWKPSEATMYQVREFFDGVKVVETAEFRKVIVECEIAVPGSTGEALLELIGRKKPKVKGRSRLAGNGEIRVVWAPASVLLALKLSHRYKKNSKHFMKTMRDIHALRKALSSELAKNPEAYSIMLPLTLWTKRREKETLTYKHPKLKNQSKGDFFDPNIGVRYVYDHDSIHEVVAHMGKPAYKFYQPEGSAVDTSRDMFEALPKHIRLLGVLEESYVLSLERSIIPFDLWDDAKKQRQAFQFALQKICTSITSGWFREFAWENFDTVMGMYDIEYVNRFKQKADAGEVKLFTGEQYETA